MITVALNPILDTYMAVGTPDTNYGSAQNCVVTNVTGVTRARTILAYDTSVIPEAATISESHLSPECSVAAVGGGTCIAELLIIPDAAAALVESQVTWNSRFTGEPWGTAGGDIEGAVAGTNFPVPTATGVMPNISTTDMLNYARDGYGYPQMVAFLLRNTVTNRSFSIASKENLSSKQFPLLYVTYTLPEEPRRGFRGSRDRISRFRNGFRYFPSFSW